MKAYMRSWIFLSRERSKTAFWAGLKLFAILALVAVFITAISQGYNPRVYAAAVDPNEDTTNPPPDCDDVCEGCYTGFKIEDDPGGGVHSGNGLTVTITPIVVKDNDSEMVAFAYYNVNIPISAVIVKGGSSSNIYAYDTARNEDGWPDDYDPSDYPKTEDGLDPSDDPGLRAPENTSSESDYHQISHIIFCYDEPPATVKIEKCINEVPEGTDMTQSFNFTIENEEQHDDDFTLVDGDSQTFELPSGTYTITETNPGFPWYVEEILVDNISQGSKNSVEIVLNEGDNKVVKFKNNKVGIGAEGGPGLEVTQTVSGEGHIALRDIGEGGDSEGNFKDDTIDNGSIEVKVLYGKDNYAVDAYHSNSDETADGLLKLKLKGTNNGQSLPYSSSSSIDITDDFDSNDEATYDLTVDLSKLSSSYSTSDSPLEFDIHFALSEGSE